MEQSYVDEYFAMLWHIKMPTCSIERRIDSKFGCMRNATEENKVGEAITMFTTLNHAEKETSGIDDDVERDNVVTWFEIENNEEIQEALVSENVEEL